MLSVERQQMPSMQVFKRIVFLFLLLAPLISCATGKTMTVAATASLLEDVAQATYKQSDLDLVRRGMPAYLMLIDGMVEALPDNKRLLISAAQLYAAYASAFIQDEDKEYAAALYARARGYALRALVQNGFKDPAARPFQPGSKRCAVPILGRILLGKLDQPESGFHGSHGGTSQG